MTVKALYHCEVTTIDNETITLERFKGSVLLIVNVASHCGFTPQYAGLEELYQRYHTRGFEILAFPCNQFGAQEPGDSATIKQFCQTNYHINFPLFAKIEVNGTHTHPLYAYLKNQSTGILGTKAIKWNFTKFLIDRDGHVVKRYAPTVTPKKLHADIEAYL